MPAKNIFFRTLSLLSLLIAVAGVVVGVVLYRDSSAIAPAPLLCGYVFGCVLAFGVLCGLVSLLGAGKPNGKGIAWKAILGIIIALALGAGLYKVVKFEQKQLEAREAEKARLADIARRKALLYGAWESTLTFPSGEVLTWLSLSPEGKFRYLSAGANVADFSGAWSFDGEKLKLKVEKFVSGPRDVANKEIDWKVAKSGENELVIGTADGTQPFSKADELASADLDALRDDYLKRSCEFLTSPGWVGTLEIEGAKLTVVSLSDASKKLLELNRFLAKPVSVWQVMVDNTAGKKPLDIDTASAALVGKDGAVVQSIAPRSMVAQKEGAESFLAPGVTTIPSKSRTLELRLYFPHGTDFTGAEQVKIKVNGAEAAIPGKFLKVSEKADFAKEMLEVLRTTAR